MANDYTSRLKKRLPAIGDINWDDEWHENEKIDEVVQGALLSVNRVISGGAVTDGGGLTVDYSAAVVWLAGTRLSLAAGDVLLTAASAGQELASWLYVNASGDVAASLTPPSGEYIPLAMVDVDSVGILRIADLRPMSALDKDASGGVPGLTLLKINFMNALGTIKSFFTNANTAARTYTFQDRNGTIADLADVALKADIASPTLTGSPATTTPGNTDNSTRIASTAHVSNAFPGINNIIGYQKFKSGIVMQWGYFTASSTAGNPVAVTFPLEYTVAYLITATVQNGTTTTQSAWFSSPTTTGFDGRCSQTNALVRWVAFGYITPA